MNRAPRDGDHSGIRGAARFVSRLLENPENPMAWSLPIARLGGLTVRVHVFTILFVGAMLVWPINLQTSGILWMAPAAVALLAIVVIHELGHAAACKAMGGRPDRLVLLPFGGLIQPTTPDNWKAHLVTALGGPMTHVLLFPALLGALHLCGLSAHAAFDLFDPRLTLTAPEFASASTALVMGKAMVWWLYAMNVYIFAINALGLMLPFDAGRVLHAVAWGRFGYERAMAAALVVGLAGAMLVGVVALVLDQRFLLLAAAIAGVAGATEKRRLTAAAGAPVSAILSADDDNDPLAPRPYRASKNATALPDDLEDDLRQTAAELGDDEPAGGAAGPAAEGRDGAKPAGGLPNPGTQAPGTPRNADRIALLTEQEHQAAVDRILAKISATGLASLTDDERALLDQATRRTRGQ